MIVARTRRDRTPSPQSEPSLTGLVVVVGLVLAILVATKWIFSLVWLLTKTVALLAVVVLVIAAVVRNKARRR
jgi:hypothetical protein